MLRAVLVDFRRWARFPTITTLDSRLSHLCPPADRIEIVGPGNYERLFTSLVRESEAVLLIAPETEGLLATLSAAVERIGVPLLGSSSAAVAVAGDKLTCYQRFRQAGLPIPTSRAARFTEDVEAIARELRFPLVGKPVDGAGCEGVVLMATKADLAPALMHLQRATEREDFLLVEYVAGTDASVSLLVADGVALPLSLNRQEIAISNNHFIYQGGSVPLEHPLQPRALAVAQQAVFLIPGLCGYVGVDLVLTEEEAMIMEVNPRLTTSYVALRQVIDLNLAQASWEASLARHLPERVTIVGQASFTKEDLLRW